MNEAQATGGGLTPARDKIILKAGTVVKVGGFPFRLVTDAEVEGHAANLGLANLQPGAVSGLAAIVAR